MGPGPAAAPDPHGYLCLRSYQTMMSAGGRPNSLSPKIR
ncbi:hypothetical protein JOF57_000266 [Mycolicibacterium lutetiense]|uniref:Uncharacterized protein n=1 Tax=Mycolicibacterium lutetiense TaxID=1641992 RepID=A0ABS4ZLL8_9MYCO|nr:hypothetical protein [Mycolicibacterium lutetiense]